MYYAPPSLTVEFSLRYVLRIFVVCLFVFVCLFGPSIFCSSLRVFSCPPMLSLLKHRPVEFARNTLLCLNEILEIFVDDITVMRLFVSKAILENELKLHIPTSELVAKEGLAVLIVNHPIIEDVPIIPGSTLLLFPSTYCTYRLLPKQPVYLPCCLIFTHWFY